MPYLDQFMPELKYRISVEKELALRNGKLSAFNDKWNLYGNVIEAGIV